MRERVNDFLLRARKGEPLSEGEQAFLKLEVNELYWYLAPILGAPSQLDNLGSSKDKYLTVDVPKLLEIGISEETLRKVDFAFANLITQLQNGELPEEIVAYRKHRQNRWNIDKQAFAGLISD